MDKYINALDSVVWYNGYSEIVYRWKDITPQNYSGYLTPLENYGGSKDEAEQLQVLWMIAVILFGDYGTSPRYGWIENIEEFKKWCLEITQTWRQSEEFKDG